MLVILLETLMVLRHTVCAFLFSQRQTKATENYFVLVSVPIQKQQETSSERSYLAPRYSRVKGELHSTGEHDMSLRHVEPMLFTLMQQLMNALGVVNGETGCLEEVERWKERDL